MNKDKFFRNDYKGFTLVEVLVVVVILVILVSVLLPVFVAYLSKDEEEKLDDARVIVMSAQNKFLKLYAEASHNSNNDCVISGDETADCSVYYIGSNKNKDCDIHKSKLASDILLDAGYNINSSEPYALIIGTGRYDIYAANPLDENYDPIKAYTVYSVTFLFTLNDEVWFWTSDKGFTKEKPYKKNKVGDLNYADNITIINGEEIKIQYYMIKNGSKNDKTSGDIWKEIDKHMNKQLNK